VVPEHPLQLSEGLGEVLQPVVEADVLLNQSVDGVLQLEAPTAALHQQNHQQREQQQRWPQSSHDEHHTPQH